MNAAYLHLATTHLPVLGTLFGLCLLLYGWLRGSEDLKRTALLTMFLTGLLSLPAYLSGAPASGVLKRALPGTLMDPMDQHAEVAVLALVAILLLAAWALFGLIAFRKSKRLSFGYSVLSLLLACVAFGLMAWTAELGGKIHHPEILRSENAR
jgi:hypothetical protein